MAEPLLELQEVETFYGQKQVLFGASLQMDAGAIAGLLGRNGMGKTTAIRSIMGFTPARAGRIRFAGDDITAWRPHNVARAGIGLVPEGRQLFRNLSVEENLVATRRPHGPGPSWTLSRVYALFPRIAQRRRHIAYQLSGGEQQMVAIGRALLTNPRLLILDEATEGLAPLIRAEIWRSLHLMHQEGCAALMIDKNVAEFADLATQLSILQTGRVVWSGSPAELLGNPEIAHMHLGV